MHAEGFRLSLAYLLDDVVRTRELYARTPDTIDDARVYSGLRSLAASIEHPKPKQLLHDLVQVTLDLCACGSVGLSVLKVGNDGVQFFSWDELAGIYAGYIGGTTPIDHSPCGYTLRRRSPQLFYYPGRYFECLSAAEPPIVEGLVLPLIKADGTNFGTLWIVSHSEAEQFNTTHVRVMQSLCSFTIAALRIFDEPQVARMQSTA